MFEQANFRPLNNFLKQWLNQKKLFPMLMDILIKK